MFAFSSGQKIPSLMQVCSWWQNDEQGKLIIEFLSSLGKITPSMDDSMIENLKNPPCGPAEAFNSNQYPKDRFMDPGNEKLLDLHSAIDPDLDGRESYPKGFGQKFCLNDVFAEEYDLADFSKALSALDYIRDLERTRRSSLQGAAQRLGITKTNWRDVLAADRDAYEWIESMLALEFDISTYYAIIFVDLRIWTMINELQSKNFYKPNVLAMLNTLFPPCVKELPNEKIEKSVLHQHRAHLFRCVLEVERIGPSALNPFLEKLLKPGTRHSWQETRNNLELYFERANHMIAASNAIDDIGFFRDPASNYAPRTPSTRTSGCGRSTFKSLRSLMRQGSYDLSILSTPNSKASSFEISQYRQRVHSRINLSTPPEQTSYFEHFESPWGFQQPSRNSSHSERSLPSRRNSGPITPETYVNTMTAKIQTTNPSRSVTLLSDTSSLRSRSRALPRPVTPLIEQGSEAAQHENFIRPFAPFIDKRREVVAHRDSLTSRSSAPNLTRMSSDSPKLSPLELTSTFSNTPEVGSFYIAGSRKMSSSLARPPLINDNFEFLKRPYESPGSPLPSTPSQRSLRKVPSLGKFFVRKKVSNASMRKDSNFDRENPLGIDIEPTAVRPMESTETFPRFSQDDALRFNESDVSLHKKYDKLRMPSLPPQAYMGAQCSEPIDSEETFPRLSLDSLSLIRTSKRQSSHRTFKNSENTSRKPLFRSRTATIVPNTEPIPFIDRFPRFSQDSQSTSRTLKKQRSYNTLEKSTTQHTLQAVRSRTVTTDIDAELPGILEDEKQLKLLLKPKSSMPNLRSKRFYEKAPDGSLGVDHFFVETGNNYERYKYVQIQRAPTFEKDRKKEELEKKKERQKVVTKAKSFSNIKHWATGAATGTAEEKNTVQPRKSSVFRPEPVEGERIRAKTIVEKGKFPMLESDPARLPPETRSKEWTRKWFLEEGRARRYDLNPPPGSPFMEENMAEENEKGGMIQKVFRSMGVGAKEEEMKEEDKFEMPRATPKKLVRPTRQRLDTIFPIRRSPPKEVKRTYQPLDLGKYTKYPGK